MVQGLCVTLTLTTLLHLILFYTAASSFRLYISPMKPLFRVGDRQQLTCLSSQCSETTEFIWSSITDKPLYSEIKTSSSESTLVFKNVNKNYENLIVCKATCQGNQKQVSAKVKVYSFPNDPIISGHDKLVLGEENTLTCKVSHVYPAEFMTVEWLKGGKVVHIQEESDMESILSYYTFLPQPNDMSESIICRATLNLDGLPSEEKTRETSASMVVHYSPKNTTIDVRPHKKLIEGENLTISCQTDSAPEGNVTLRRVQNGEETVLVSSDGTQTSFSIPFTNVSHSGLYVCEAINKYGHQRENVQITVQAFPLYPTIESLGPFLEGNVTNLTCTVHLPVFPVGSFHIQWLERELELHSARGNWSNDQQNFSLTVPFKPKDSDHNKTFTCKVSLEHIQKTSSVTVAVYYSPKNTTIDVRPHKKLIEGENLTISCQTDSAPEGNVTLRRVQNGEETVLVSSDGTQTSFSIPFTNVSHSGLYVCEAINKYGHQRENVQITVQAFPLYPTIESLGPFLEGNVTNLTCTVHLPVFPVGSFHIQWLERELELHSARGNWSNDQQNFSLTVPFKPKDSDHNKTFTCKVSLEHIQKTSSVTVAVYYSPKNTTIDVRPHKKLIEGENLTISCQTDSAPEGNVTLRRVQNEEETVLVSSNGTQTSFSIPFTNVSHSGLYVCEAINKYGHQRENVQITVQAHPRIVTVISYSTKEEQEAETVSICCQSVSSPTPDITLRNLDNGNENGTFLPGNPTSTDSGLYQFNPTNASVPGTDVTAVLQRLNSIYIIISGICLAILTIVASSLNCIRIAKRKGFYELTEGIPKTV